MRIGIDVIPLCQPQPTGVQLISKHLVEALVKRYPEDEFVLTAVVPRATLPQLYAWELLGQANVTPAFWGIRAALFHTLMPWWQRLAWPEVEVLTKKITVWHSFDWFTLPSKVPATAYVFDLSTQLFPQWHTPENVASQNQRLHRAAARCSHLFALSHATKQDFLTQFSFDADKISVVYPDAAAIFTPNKPLSSIKVSIKGKTLAPRSYFLYVGTLEPRKNVSRLIQAYTRLPEPIKRKVPLVMVGSWGWKTSSFAHLLQEEKHIIQADYVTHHELPALYQQASALVYPSLYEGFGMPVLEALRCGTPVLTSNISSLPEVGGKAALYCNPLSITSITEQLHKLIQMKPAERQRRIQSGLAQARTFSLTASAEQMHQQWQELATIG